MGKPSRHTVLTKTREISLGKIGSLEARVDGLGRHDDSSADEFETCLDLLETAWSEFASAQDELMTIDDDDEFGSDYYGQQEDRYVKLRSHLRSTLKAFRTPVTAKSEPSTLSSSCVKLPKIDLPNFTGKLTEWIPFYDLFAAAVDSQASLTNAQKLQYLKASVKNEPSQLISSLTLTGTIKLH